MRTRIACMVLVWLASATVTRADWGVNQNQDLDWLVGDAQFFAPRDLSDFDTKPHANEGVFFTANFLRWRVTPPETSTIGNRDAVGHYASFPEVVPPFFDTLPRQQLNSLNTSWYRTEDFDGQDFSLGWVEDNHGWFVRGFEMHGRDQTITGRDTMVAFADPQQLLVQQVDFFNFLNPFAGITSQLYPVGIIFDDLKADLETRFWTVEANFMYRHRTHYGDWVEFFAGPRYLNFGEEFRVKAWGGLLNESWWYTDAHNHIIGPQIGMRYFKRYSSWQVSFEGRFMPAFNYQDVKQLTHLASRGGTGSLLLVPNTFPLIQVGNGMAPLQSNSNERTDEYQFSAVGEVRVEAAYIITRKINLKIGYNLMVVSGLARPTAMVDYTFPEMGIRRDENDQTMFAHGFNFGVEINH